VPAISLVFFGLLSILAEEVKNAATSVHKCLSGSSSGEGSLPVSRLLQSKFDIASRSTLVGTPPPAPQSIELRSGWDEMLDVRAPKRTKSRSSVFSDAPASQSSSPSTISQDDEVFTASTLSYLSSPVAQSLGIRIPSPVLSPPPAYTSPVKADHVSSTPPGAKGSELPGHVPQAVPEDASSTISSIWDAPWPQPPPTDISPLSLSAPARPDSPLSVEEFGYPLHPSITPPHLQSRPFQGHPVSPSVPDLKQSHSRKSSLKNLRRTWSKEAMNRGYAPSDVIYMTVVKETETA